MKNLRYLIILALLVFHSCEEFIDLQPLDQLNVADYWKSSTDLKNYVQHFYPVAFPGKEYGGSTVDDNTYHSDNIIHPSISAILNGERVTSTGRWTGAWSDIRDVNIFLVNYQKCNESFESYQHYVGEAHFFRAWFYFNLIKTYGDVPWYSEPLEINSKEELMRPRDPRTLIVDNILADLDKAVQYLAKRSDVGNCKINKEAALAFKTRVALYEGTWQKYHAGGPFGTSGTNPGKYFQACVEAAEELINDGNYQKGIYNTGNTDLDYYQLFGFDDMSDINEVLLYKAFSNGDGFFNFTQTYIVSWPQGKGITWDLVSSYLGIDGKPYDYLGVASTNKGNAFLTKIASDCDPRLKSTIYIPGDLMAEAKGMYFTKPPIDEGALLLVPTGFQAKKTSNPQSPAASGMGTSETGMIIFRYAEVLLNYAEALCEIDNTVAFTYLNLLRSRAGMPDFNVNPQSSDPNLVNYGYTISDALYEIRRERRVELALDGLRDEDLMRWAAHTLYKGKRPKGYPFKSTEFPNFVPHLDNNGLIDYWANDLPNGYQFTEGRDYLNSIPLDEITINSNITQNPGW